MTSTLVINLAGPMQSWGDSSRFTQRHTRAEPTKSGIVGLLAAALGRRRSEPIEDLTSLRFGVRTDQPGRMDRDFQTEIDWRTGKARALTNRYFLADAKFVAAVCGPREVLEGLVDALREPTFPLYLGRRAFPPAGPIRTEIVDAGVHDALAGAEWTAAAHHRRTQGSRVRLPIVRDAEHGELAAESVRDIPISFDPEHRQYEWRDVVHDVVEVVNPDSQRSDGRDWLAALGDA
ncbi:MAG: type I-E CRISPR-associated protein Cas5/CasD [Gordonia sp. (in: high G+C Gram-positive bacteria)]